MDNQAHPTPHAEPASAADIAAVHAQLGRPPRGLRAVAHRCPCGNPDVVETQPRLEDGTPFPTLYYLTCPRAASAIGTLEAEGVMKRMTARLAEDPPLATSYRAAHEDYIARRDAIEVLEGFPSAGGMPDRVKCLHVLAAHSLAAGPGVNPLGDETVAMLPDWWAKGPCVPRDAEPRDAEPRDERSRDERSRDARSRDEQPQHSRPQNSSTQHSPTQRSQPQDRAGTRPEKGDRP